MKKFVLSACTAVALCMLPAVASAQPPNGKFFGTIASSNAGGFKFSISGGKITVDGSVCNVTKLASNEVKFKCPNNKKCQNPRFSLKWNDAADYTKGHIKSSNCSGYSQNAALRIG